MCEGYKSYTVPDKLSPEQKEVLEDFFSLLQELRTKALDFSNEALTPPEEDKRSALLEAEKVYYAFSDDFAGSNFLI